MYEPYKILVSPAFAEVELKKSRFLANVIPAETEAAAASFIEETRKKYYDARHNCYAYILGKDGGKVKYSDDGEPAQTAGLPIFNILKESGIKNVCTVVTRYFGGTLLGAGPLARMYADATKEALASAETAWMRYGIEFSVKSDYSDGEKIRRFLEKENADVVDITYAEKVCFVAKTGFETFADIEKNIISLTASRAEINKEKEAYFIDRN